MKVNRAVEKNVKNVLQTAYYDAVFDGRYISLHAQT